MNILKAAVPCLLVCGALIASSGAIARPAPSHTVSVKVINGCNVPITIHLDNNWGSQQTGDYALAPAGSKDDKNHQSDSVGFFFNSNNDEEFYTISYQNAVCKVDYPMIRDYWMLDAVIRGCDRTPTCSFVPSATLKAAQ